MKQYLIKEEELREMLLAWYKMQVLERDGVDNWEWYMESRTEFIKDGMRELPGFVHLNDEELEQIVEEEDYDLEDLVQDDIDHYWAPCLFMTHDNDKGE